MNENNNLKNEKLEKTWKTLIKLKRKRSKIAHSLFDTALLCFVENRFFGARKEVIQQVPENTEKKE